MGAVRLKPVRVILQTVSLVVSSFNRVLFFTCYIYLINFSDFTLTSSKVVYFAKILGAVVC